MNHAGRATPFGFDEHRLVRQAKVGRRDPGRVAARIPGTHAVGQREAVREAEWGGGSGGRDPGAAEVPHTGRGRQRARACQVGRRRRPCARSRSARSPTAAGSYTPVMAKRDPRAVLGVESDATPTQIKAAWRRLARTNHPDLTGDDPAASRVATRRMAEINDAYAALTREIDAGRAQRAWIGCGRHAVRARRRTSTRRPASPEADPAGHRPRRHQRDIPAPEPGGRQRRGTDDPPWPAAASRRPCRKRAATRVDADGPARPRSAASFPAATGALAPAGRGDGHPVRQVPRPHARSDRGLRAVVHRLGGGDRQPRSGPGQRGAGHPGRSRSPGGPSARPPDVRARRPHRLSGCRKRTIALRYRRATLMLMFGSPSDNRCRPDGPPGLLAEEPVTRLVSWIRDPSPEPPRTNDRFQFRDRRPRDLLVRSRVGV